MENETEHRLSALRERLLELNRVRAGLAKVHRQSACLSDEMSTLEEQIISDLRSARLLLSLLKVDDCLYLVKFLPPDSKPWISIHPLSDIKNLDACTLQENAA